MQFLKILQSIFVLLLVFLTFQNGVAQVSSNLIAHYDFNRPGCPPLDATGNQANNGIYLTGNDTTFCDCGVNGNAYYLDGFDKQFVVSSSAVLDLFDTEDFSISMYFKPATTGISDSQVLLSKRSELCSDSASFEVRYSPVSGFLTVLLKENDQIDGSLNAFLDLDKCWQHVVVSRAGRTTLLYVNGELITERIAPEIVNIENENGVLSIGEASCLITDTNFEGHIDDIRLYGRVLEAQEVEMLYYFPDRIGNASFSGDTLVFKGSEIDIFVPNTCAVAYEWTPADGVSDTMDLEPTLEPLNTTTYTLALTDSIGCTTLDTLKVTVVDPDSLNCTEVFLPDAFTPNDDGLNDTYGISNPFVIDEVSSFEILDRWGERLFVTNDAFDRWDGRFKGEKVNPGIYVYQVSFICDGQENNAAGSFMVLR